MTPEFELDEKVSKALDAVYAAPSEQATKQAQARLRRALMAAQGKDGLLRLRAPDARGAAVRGGERSGFGGARFWVERAGICGARLTADEGDAGAIG